MNDRSSLDLYYRYVCLNDLSMLYTQRWSKHSIILFFSLFLFLQMYSEECLPEGYDQFASLAGLRIRPTVYRFRASSAGSHPHRSNGCRKFFFLYYPGSFYVLTRLVTLSSKQQNEKPPRLWNFMKREYLSSTDEYCVEVVGGCNIMKSSTYPARRGSLEAQHSIDCLLRPFYSTFLKRAGETPFLVC